MFPQMYRLWSAACKQDVRQWKVRCTACARGETFVDRGALDDSDLGSWQSVSRCLLDCRKCYERIPLTQLETFAWQSGYALFALYAALDLHAGAGEGCSFKEL
eukprot:6279611-Amphidinium_carterae.1